MYLSPTLGFFKTMLVMQVENVFEQADLQTETILLITQKIMSLKLSFGILPHAFCCLVA